MNNVVQIQFADKMLSFDTFLGAMRILMKEEVGKAVGKRQFITQSQAYDTYGSKNVKAWVKQKRIKVYARGHDGKVTRIEYRVPELEACANDTQGYLYPTYPS